MTVPKAPESRRDPDAIGWMLGVEARLDGLERLLWAALALGVISLAFAIAALLAALEWP